MLRSIKLKIKAYKEKAHLCKFDTTDSEYVQLAAHILLDKIKEGTTAERQTLAHQVMYCFVRVQESIYLEKDEGMQLTKAEPTSVAGGQLRTSRHYTKQIVSS